MREKVWHTTEGDDRREDSTGTADSSRRLRRVRKKSKCPLQILISITENGIKDVSILGDNDLEQEAAEETLSQIRGLLDAINVHIAGEEYYGR